MLTMQVVYDVFLQIRVAKLLLLGLCRLLLLLLPCLHGLAPYTTTQQPHSRFNAHSLGHMSQAHALPVCFTFALLHLAFTLRSPDSLGPSNCLPGYRVCVVFTAWPINWWITGSV